jgi:putative ABC transport system permease protein
VLQVAIALTLAVATGLLVRSMQHVESQTLGFVPQNVLAATMAVPRSLLGGNVTSLIDASNLVIAAIEQHPGVIAAAVGTRPLATSSGNVIRSVVPAGPEVPIRTSDVSTNYFSVIGATTLEGRTFGPDDHPSSAPVIVLNARAVAALGFGGSAVGRLVELDRVNRTVIGVVANVRQNLEGESLPTAYVPTSQSRTTWSGQLLVRTARPASEMIRELLELVGRRSEGITLYRFQTMDERILQLTASRRFLLRLVTVFAALAIVLAIVGIAGVMAESVAQRVREIGIRMALGARPQSIVRLFVARGVRVVVSGAAIGLAVIYQFRNTLEAYVYGVPATDVWSYTLAAALLVIAGTVACYLPARRAARIDPSTALR